MCLQWELYEYKGLKSESNLLETHNLLYIIFFKVK